jgi:hypothetical protein
MTTGGEQRPAIKVQHRGSQDKVEDVHSFEALGMYPTGCSTSVSLVTQVLPNR